MSVLLQASRKRGKTKDGLVQDDKLENSLIKAKSQQVLRGQSEKQSNKTVLWAQSG